MRIIEYNIFLCLVQNIDMKAIILRMAKKAAQAPLDSLEAEQAQYKEATKKTSEELERMNAVFQPLL